MNLYPNNMTFAPQTWDLLYPAMQCSACVIDTLCGLGDRYEVALTIWGGDALCEEHLLARIEVTMHHDAAMAHAARVRLNELRAARRGTDGADS